MTIPGGVTRFPNGLSVGDPEGIYANLPSTYDPRVLWENISDFELPLDTTSEWNEFGTGVLDYPDLPFGVVRLEPGNALSYGINQGNCQGFDFTRGTDLWYSVSIAQELPSNINIWAGMVDGIPTNPTDNDEFDEACIFHILTSGQIDLEIWTNAASVPVQTITVPGITFARTDTFRELAYHYDGERIEIAINGITVARELTPVVPDITLHALLECEDGGAGGDSCDFDYIYMAQLRQPL